MKSTAVLSVSAPGLSCERIVGRLAVAGIDASVTRNTTSINGRLETGCRIVSTVTSDAEVVALWVEA
ncbi:unnamed protein product, partial [marine sediment metagenome]